MDNEKLKIEARAKVETAKTFTPKGMGGRTAYLSYLARCEGYLEGLRACGAITQKEYREMLYELHFNTLA